MSDPPFIPYGHQSINEADINAVSAVLRGSVLTTGPAVDDFETAFAGVARASDAVAVSSGTAALYIATRLFGIGAADGDAVIVPSMTFMATASAPHLAGAEIVFADVEPDTGLITADTLVTAIAEARSRGLEPRAVFPVHLNGQSPDLPAIAAAARDNGLKIIEDACHALGTTNEFGGQTSSVGDCAHSDIAAFSFHPVKAIAMGEGGALTTNDKALADLGRQMRSHGIVRDPAHHELRDQALDASGEPNPWYHELHQPGFNFRVSDIHCALGLSQLARLTDFIARRRAIARRYDTAFAPFADLVRPVRRVPWSDPAWHLYVLQIAFDRIGLERAAVMRALRERGIGTQVHYIPVHRQPYYRKRYGSMELPGADAYYRQALSIPIYPDLTDDDLQRVVSEILSVLRLQ